MKAILVIDMPNKCYECPLMSKDMYCKAYANIVKGRKLCVEDDVLYGERNYGCPLKPMPQEKEDLYFPCNEYEQAFNEGYNRCIDDILGEKEW